MWRRSRVRPQDLPLLMAAAFFCACPWGCSFYAAELAVEVQPPPLPPHWRESFPGLAFRLIYLTGKGWQERVLAAEGTAAVGLAKGTNLPVLAVPLVRGGRVELPPAGAVLPRDLEGARLRLRWEEGPTARALERLWRAGFDPSGLDSRRLSAEIRSRLGQDPWRVDLDRLVRAAVEDRLRVTEIRPAPAAELRLWAGPGRWFLESPYCSPWPVAEGEALVVAEVPLGVHRLFAQGREEWILLRLSEQGVEWKRLR